MRNFELMEASTGELIPAVVWIRRRWKGEGFFMGFQEAFTHIAKKRLGAEAQTVFLYLLGQLDFDSYLNVPQTKIAKELRMQQPHVSRAITTLVEHHVLLPGPKIGRSSTYRLNPYVGAKGRLKNITQMRAKMEKEQTESPQAS